MLREKFLAADVGITGANFLVAETGTSVIVTNEGNGDLTQTLPKAHIVLASLEKLVPTLEDLAQLLRVLARSATGQEMSVYTTLSTGPRRADDPDGPGEYHVVLLDNGRSSMLGGEFRDMLRCIRCGACMNHCPVYHAVGGHAYGWVYPGPMGAVLTPSLIGIDKAGHLPNASTFCGRCEEVCPVRIPLPRMMRAWREREFERHLSPATMRSGLAVWAFFAKRPRLYGFATAMAARLLALGGPRARTVLLVAAGLRLDALPRFSGAAGRDLPVAMEASQRPVAPPRAGAIRHDRARSHFCDDSPLARRHRDRGAAPRRPSPTRLAGHPRGVVPARGQLPPPAAARSVRPHGGSGLRHGRARRRRGRYSGRGRGIPARPQSAARGAPRRRPAALGCAVGARRRSKSGAAPPTGTISPRCRTPSRRSPKPARWC